MGVGHLIICTLSQPKCSTSIIAVRALKCDFRICRQICRSVVCLNDVADRGLDFERSDLPFGGFSTAIVAVVCCLDGQRTGAYTGETIAAGDDVILSILVDTFISKISFPMQPGPEIGSISDA